MSDLQTTTETDKQTRTRKPFWESSLAADKVGLALDALTVARETFEEAYLATRQGRGASEITDSQIEAVETFHSDHDYMSLKLALGMTSDAGVAGVLRRVSEAS